jgi:hypothetical protein
MSSGFIGRRFNGASEEVDGLQVARLPDRSYRPEMAKPKTKQTRRPTKDDLFADGLAEGITEQYVVAQFKPLWAQLGPADRARANLVISTLGALGDSQVWLRDAFDSLKKGKMPTLDHTRTALPQLEQAAITYVIEMGLAEIKLDKKSKKTTKKRK